MEEKFCISYSQVMDLCEQEIKKIQNGCVIPYFRGQSNSCWEILPSILRSENRTEEYAKKWDNNLSAFENIAKIQHTYENKIPTRFIDFSTCYKVALYFACNENFNKDGALFMLPYSPITEKSIYTKIICEFFNIKTDISGYDFTVKLLQQFPNKDIHSIASVIGAFADTGFLIHPTKDEYKTMDNYCKRISAQKACFIVCSNKVKSRTRCSVDILNGTITSTIINSTFVADYKFMKKYIIDKNAKKTILEELQKENITKKTLNL